VRLDAASSALANQLPLPRLESALVQLSRKLPGPSSSSRVTVNLAGVAFPSNMILMIRLTRDHYIDFKMRSIIVIIIIIIIKNVTYLFK